MILNKIQKKMSKTSHYSYHQTNQWVMMIIIMKVVAHIEAWSKLLTIHSWMESEELAPLWSTTVISSTNFYHICHTNKLKMVLTRDTVQMCWGKHRLKYSTRVISLLLFSLYSLDLCFHWGILKQERKRAWQVELLEGIWDWCYLC